MADDTIKEYLVALGYKVDKASEQRFVNSLNSAEKTVAVLAASLAAAATAIYATVLKVASSLDDLYFSAQRTNTSVSNVKAYTYALSQLGVSASAAGSTIEGIAKAIRTNPGNESLIRTLGVATRDANGNLRDTVDILVDLDKALGKKPQYIASQYASALGIDEGTFNQIRGQAGKIQKDMAGYRKMAGEMGVNPDKAAADANELMTTVREFQAQVDLLVQKIAQDLGPALMGYITEFSQWVTEHRAEIVDFVGKVVAAFVSMVKAAADLAKQMEPLWQAFDKFAKEIGEDGGLHLAFKFILGYVAGEWATKMMAAAAGVSSSFGFLGPLLALIAGGALASSYFNPDGGRSPVTGRFSGGRPYDMPGTTRPNNGPDRGPLTWGKVKNWVLKRLGFGGGGGGKVTDAANMDIPAEGRALLDTIASTEAHAYNVLYGGGTFDDYGDHPRQAKTIVSGPNVGQTTSAAGRYQFLASTWDEQAKQLGLKDFSPENQDKAAWSLAQRRYAQASGGRSLLDDLKSNDPDILAYVAQALHPTWTSLPGGSEQGQGASTMKGRYDAALAREQARAAAAAPAPAAKTPAQAWAEKRAGILSRNHMMDPNLSGAGTPLIAPGFPVPGAQIGLSQNNTFNVYGSSDPHITAAEVARKQGTLNGALLSNVKGAVQ